MQRQQRLIIFGLILVAFAGLVWAVVNSMQSRQRTATLTVQVVPSGSTVTVNGRGVRSSELKVKPGKYTVKASKKGFETYSEDFDIQKNDSKFFGAALVSNSPETANWYTDHPKDQQIAESISGTLVEQGSSEALSNAPLIRALPMIGAGYTYRIDYGYDRKLTGQDTMPVIYVSANTPEARQRALRWMRHQGVDLSDYKIVFKEFKP